MEKAVKTYSHKIQNGCCKMALYQIQPHREQDSMEHETGLKCVVEYSGTMNTEELPAFAFTQILEYCVIKMIGRENAVFSTYNEKN